jgi:hypothetical protein
MPEEDAIAEVLELNRRLLESIAQRDWATYRELCDPSLTAFEPEARGSLVQGMGFHHYYFQLGGDGGPQNMTICAPQVRLMGDVAVASYIRLVQRLNAAGKAETIRSQETRVWQRQGGKWRHVHFHRSAD